MVMKLKDEAHAMWVVRYSGDIYAEVKFLTPYT